MYYAQFVTPIIVYCNDFLGSSCATSANAIDTEKLQKPFIKGIVYTSALNAEESVMMERIRELFRRSAAMAEQTCPNGHPLSTCDCIWPM